eukprot:TRINITY_DN1322_c0_g1_i1.p1 TRINITY_DN1322_c0_g1~~TRINITY_DN1322_c0_g1_i1.p1  ORF type:complete len:1061 (-),score=446.08 TRINITY_DN1322_c0_g1_i1:37-3219(-)
MEGNEGNPSASPSVPQLPARKIFTNGPLPIDKSSKNEFQRRELPVNPLHSSKSSNGNSGTPNKNASVQNRAATMRPSVPSRGALPTPPSSSSLSSSASSNSLTTTLTRSASGGDSKVEDKVGEGRPRVSSRGALPTPPLSSSLPSSASSNDLAVKKSEETNGTVRPRLPSRNLPEPPNAKKGSLAKSLSKNRAMTMHGGSRKPPSTPGIFPTSIPPSNNNNVVKEEGSPKALLNLEEEEKEEEKSNEKKKNPPPRLGSEAFGSSRLNLSSNSLRRRSMVANVGRPLPVPGQYATMRPSNNKNNAAEEEKKKEDEENLVKNRRSIHESLIKGLAEEINKEYSEKERRLSFRLEKGGSFQKKMEEEMEKMKEEEKREESLRKAEEKDVKIEEKPQRTEEIIEERAEEEKTEEKSEKVEEKKEENAKEVDEKIEEKTDEKIEEKTEEKKEKIEEKPAEETKEKPKGKRRKLKRNVSRYWEKALTDDGDIYWYDPVSGESSWSNPCSPLLIVSRETSFEPLDSSLTLWYSYKSEEGYTYYYNYETQETVWSLPEGARVAEPEPEEAPEAETAPNEELSEEKQEEEKRAKNARQKKRVIQELIDTERAYVADLRFMEVQYMQPLRTQNIISEEDLLTLFGNIMVLQGVNLGILIRLEEYLEGNEESISKIFEDSCEDLKVYADYIANQIFALKLLKKLIKKNKAFREHYENVKKLPENRGLELIAFLSKPLQRLCKYPLLFKEMLRWTEEDDIEYMSVQLVCGQITKVVNFVNEKQRESENQMKVRQIDKWIGKKVNIYDGKRTFVSEEKGKQIWTRSGKGPKDWTLFLFDDLLLITEELVPEKKHKVRCLIPFDSFTHVKEPDESSPFFSPPNSSSSISSMSSASSETIGSPTLSSSSSAASINSNTSYVFVLAFRMNEEGDMESVTIGSSTQSEKNRLKEEIEAKIKRNTINSPVKVPLRTVAPSSKNPRQSRMSIVPPNISAVAPGSRATLGPNTFAANPVASNPRASIVIPPRKLSDEKKEGKKKKEEKKGGTLRFSTIRGGDDLVSELKNKLKDSMKKEE